MAHPHYINQLVFQIVNYLSWSKLFSWNIFKQQSVFTNFSKKDNLKNLRCLTSTFQLFHILFWQKYIIYKYAIIPLQQLHNAMIFKFKLCTSLQCNYYHKKMRVYVSYFLQCFPINDGSQFTTTALFSSTLSAKLIQEILRNIFINHQL